MTDLMYEPEDTMIDAKCVCCGRPVRVDYYDEQICKRCEDYRSPFLDAVDVLESEVQELKAELAKFHPCEPWSTSALCDEDGCYERDDAEVHHYPVYHKEG